MCPNVLLKEGRWDEFKERVKVVLNATSKGECEHELSSGATSVTTANVVTVYNVGEKVRVKESATQYATGQALAWFVKGSIYEVTKVAGDKLLLSDIISWVWIDDVEKVSANTVVATAYPFLVEFICLIFYFFCIIFRLFAHTSTITYLLKVMPDEYIPKRYVNYY